MTINKSNTLGLFSNMCTNPINNIQYTKYFGSATFMLILVLIILYYGYCDKTYEDFIKWFNKYIYKKIKQLL